MAAAGLLGAAGACHEGRPRLGSTFDARVYPPPPAVPRVVALGNLHTGKPLTREQVRIAEFLFGAAPEPDLHLVRPMDVAVAASPAADATGGGAGRAATGNPAPGYAAHGHAVAGSTIRVCDIALAAVFDLSRGELTQARLAPLPALPTAISACDDGGWLVVDSHRARVQRYDAAGRQLATYGRSIDGQPDRPADALLVGHEVWITSVAQHRIDIFDAASGELRRTIGRRGRGRGEFGMPLGLALGPDGHVYVVDMLNNRVQVLDRDGKWVRTIGGHGDKIGQFGRPKDVAVGPDGTVFVTDASSQRVHVFAPDGQPLLAFGEPDMQGGALELPGGIALVRDAPIARPDLPPGFEPAYYVLVAEQSALPGVRVYAWRGGQVEPPATPRAAAGDPRLLPVNAAGTINPHWRAEQCGVCHDAGREQPAEMTGGRARSTGPFQAIPPEQADLLCLSCHDGVKAIAESHPIARPAREPQIVIPADWPLSDGRLSCLTCHDIVRHCDPAARRPIENPAMVRRFDPAAPFASCNQCHVADPAWRVNPHDNLAAGGEVIAESCGFCHLPGEAARGDARGRIAARSQPARDVPARGVPARGVPAVGGLRTSGLDLCMACHTKHWDYFPAGHVGQPASAAIRANMAAAEAAGGRRWALPLADGRVTCYSCHNPHEPGLFPADSKPGAVAREPDDAAAALRLDNQALCTVCHGL